MCQGFRLKNINGHYIHLCPVRTVHLVERALINTYAFSIYRSNYYSFTKNISTPILKRNMLEPCPNFVSRPPRAILPKKTENLPTNLPKKAEILPKVQTCVTQHKLVSLQYKPCLSFLYNQNNKPAHATLYIRYRVSP